ncbi:porin [Paraburkholderia phenoliruptrix]|uniref:porin n=1 Tax=Paraburkholderia phenoliruptrix TaxID=252970 RepID=UPI001CB790D4|nr:porin [Paraburkholderia phenoliruptrix]
MRARGIVAASLCIFNGSVYAQSSVTLYGIADVGFTYINKSSPAGASGAQYSLASGNLQGDRWGLRGDEKLGEDLEALFVLEGGMTITNGMLAQGGDLFGRQAYVGLSSRLGTLTLGRQYDSIVDYTSVFASTSQWASRYGAHPGNLDNNLPAYVINNSIKFASKTYSGFRFGGLFSLGGVAVDFSRKRIWSIGGAYSRDSLQVGAAYLNAKQPNFSYFGNNALSSATASNMTGSTVYSGYASADTLQIISVGVSYTVDAVTLGVAYSNTQFKNIGALAGLPASGAGGTAKFHNAEVNMKFRITPFLVAGIAYNYTDGYGANHAAYDQLTSGVDYFLTKRTDIYLVGVYQHASGTDSTGRQAVANIATVSPSSSANQVLATLGIRHRF